MTTLFAKADQLPPDPLLGLMTAFRADPRADKLDLGVGMYKDAAGRIPVFGAVHEAELRLAERNGPKAYEGPQGNLAFCEAVARLVYGDDAFAREFQARTALFTTPGGCGALGDGMALIARLTPDARVWISDPCWPNHPHVVRNARLEPVSYPYLDADSGLLDRAAMMDALQAMQSGDVLLVQGPCHNPSGVDLVTEGWRALAGLCNDKGVIPFVDIAYHGLGQGLEEDMEGVRALLRAVPTALISYSCSKNFGLYRERTGLLILQAETGAQADAVASHVADITRALYSMPPAHGAALVAEILADDRLSRHWREELAAMRNRVTGLRTALGEALRTAGVAAMAPRLEQGAGMFALLPLHRTGIDALRREHGIYMPGSGRINVAGLPDTGIDKLAQRIVETHQHLSA